MDTKENTTEQTLPLDPPSFTKSNSNSVASSSTITLYTYYRSSCSWRVRLALTYKQLSYESKFIHLLHNEQHSSTYTPLNPSHLLPTLVIDGHTFTQSMAILEYLEETRPQYPLLPTNPKDRAIVRAMAQIIVSDTQPLQNLRVLQYLTTHHLNLTNQSSTSTAIDLTNLQSNAKQMWSQHWIELGLQSLEVFVQNYSSNDEYCFRNSFSIIDCCLVPQIYNALRFQVNVASLTPHLWAIYLHLSSLEFVKTTIPEEQQDAP